MYLLTKYPSGRYCLKTDNKEVFSTSLFICTSNCFIAPVAISSLLLILLTVVTLVITTSAVSGSSLIGVKSVSTEVFLKESKFVFELTP